MAEDNPRGPTAGELMSAVDEIIGHMSEADRQRLHNCAEIAAKRKIKG